MEIKIKTFLGRERFQWSSGDAKQLFIFIWPNIGKLIGKSSEFCEKSSKIFGRFSGMFQKCFEYFKIFLKIFRNLHEFEYSKSWYFLYVWY